MENKPSLAEKISVMTAFESGAEIEAKYRGKWIVIPEPLWDWSNFNYKIKKEAEIDWEKVPVNTKVQAVHCLTGGVYSSRYFALHIKNVGKTYCFSEQDDRKRAVGLSEVDSIRIHPDVKVERAWLKDSDDE